MGRHDFIVTLKLSCFIQLCQESGLCKKSFLFLSFPGMQLISVTTCLMDHLIRIMHHPNGSSCLIPTDCLSKICRKQMGESLPSWDIEQFWAVRQDTIIASDL